MGRQVREALLVIAGVCTLLLLAVSFMGTHGMALLFHKGSEPLAILYASAIEGALIMLGAGIVLRMRAKQDTRLHWVILSAVLTLTMAANGFMGADSFAPQYQVLDRARAWSAWWILPVAYGVATPLVLFGFVSIFSTLLSEQAHNSSETGAKQEQPRPRLKARIIELYQERPELDPGQVAQLTGASVTYARKVRAEVVKK